MMHIFCGYETVIDRKLSQYISFKNNDYEEGVNIRPEKFMELALNKYETLDRKNLWGEPTDEQQTPRGEHGLQVSVEVLSRCGAAPSR